MLPWRDARLTDAGDRRYGLKLSRNYVNSRPLLPICLRDLMMGYVHKQLILVLVVSAALPARNYQHSALLSRNYTLIPLPSRLVGKLHRVSHKRRSSKRVTTTPLLHNVAQPRSWPQISKISSSDPFVISKALLEPYWSILTLTIMLFFLE